MKHLLTIIWLLACITARSQPFTLRGVVTGDQKQPLQSAFVILNKGLKADTTDKDGHFQIVLAKAGRYTVHITHQGYEPYDDTLSIDSNTVLPFIALTPSIHMLDEVKVVEKVLAVIQKDDTVEYNSKAFKVNPDADAADLLKKMPALDISGKTVTAQGEQVIKIVVDGKPFFGTDPYATLKNLPADIIDKVQVYNEKSDQEKFTKFSEGPTTKTINIVTKPDKRKGVFGTAYAGGGNDNSNDRKYGAGFSLNRFDHDRRFTITAQTNNINEQNFTDENAAANSNGGSGGFVTTNAGGVNYTDKWGKNTEVSGSYTFSKTDNTAQRQLHKTYLLSADSGQVYNENSPSSGIAYSHRLNMRIDHKFDSMNSLLWQPQVSVQQNNLGTTKVGATMEGVVLLNQTNNRNDASRLSANVGNNFLFRHRFIKTGRTLSLSANTSNNTDNGITLLRSQNYYYTNMALNDTLDQRSLQGNSTWNLSGNATYTEPLGDNGAVKIEYNLSYMPARADKNTSDYSGTTNSYSVPDSLFSNLFYSINMQHKGGASYMLHSEHAELSVGMNYQYATLSNDQKLPVSYSLQHNFSNWMPAVMFRYKFSKKSSLQCNYYTTTQNPSVGQLQNVVNNTDPLHVRTGNPGLKQPYKHSLVLRYAGTGKKSASISASVTGNYTQNYISSALITASADTTIDQRIFLPRGSQLSLPENVDGCSSLKGNLSYGLPLTKLKCQLNFALNATIGYTPAIINNAVNYQDNQSESVTLSLHSNISEHIDFSVSSNTGVTINKNSLNSQLNQQYVNEVAMVSANLILWKGIVLSSGVNYWSNTGSSVGYNNDYFLWNISLGKKLFKKRQGDIRLSVFDALNQNSNLQHTTTETYTQDMRTNILQRYYVFVFTYKLREFGK